MMQPRLAKVLVSAAVVSAACLSGIAIYHSKIGLGLRAQLGQQSGTFLYALQLYNDDDIAGALKTIRPLVANGHEPSLNLVCGFVNGYEPVAATPEACVIALQEQPTQRLASLTDLAIFAQEWDTAADLIATRLDGGDQTAHFDRARLIYAAPKGRFDPADLMAALEQSNAAQDPRGQYATVVNTLNASSGGAITPVLTELLTRQPKLKASDAYFELAKLMQTGAISSDLSYVDVLLRADQTGNPHAARYLAQYYAANPELDPTGNQRTLWTAKAAGTDDPVAQYNAAIAILNSPDAAKPMGEAVALLDRSAAAGFVPALNMLGATLYQNPGLLEQPAAEVQAQALALMEQAAAKDDLNALFNLGNIYLYLQDQPKALGYLRKGASLGSEPAQALLDQLGAATD
jgi:TPR repeat protein